MKKLFYTGLYGLLIGGLLCGLFVWRKYTVSLSFKRTAAIVWSIAKDLPDSVVMDNLPTKIDVGTAVARLTFFEAFNKFFPKTPATISLIAIGNIKLAYHEANDLLQLLDEVLVQKTYYFNTAKPNPVIIDCGSNIGLSMIFFKKLYPDAQIIGFEPHPDTISLLKKNLALNHINDVTVVPKALGYRDGTLELVSQCAGQLGASLHIAKDAFNNRIKVPVVRLSEWITRPVDFLKMDIEGGEIDALHDLDDCGKIKFIQEMVIEFHNCIFKSSSKLFSIIEILERNEFEWSVFELFYNYEKPTKAGAAATMIRAVKK